MDLLTNAIESIRVGIADYQSDQRPRLLSAVRNIHAGILLLFKEKLRRISPKDSNNALMMAKVRPARVANGDVVFVGVGKNTVDVQQIRERFKALDINLDWERFDKVNVARNQVEHLYPQMSQNALQGLISNSFLNEILVGVHRSFHDQGTLADFTDWAGNLGLPNPFGVNGWPTFCASNLGYYGYFCWDADNHSNQALTAEVLDDNATWTKGKHTIKFGGRVRLEQNNVRELQQAQGSHDFNGGWTGQSAHDPNDTGRLLDFTGDGFADLLLGLPTTLRNQFNRGYFYFRQREIGLYFNDSWKVSPRLTLNLGLRWDKWTPYHEKLNRLTTADISSISDPNRFEVITPGNHDMHSLPGVPPSVLTSWEARGLTFNTARAIGYPDNLFAADNNNFGPRLGVAFKLTPTTVLRV